MQNTEFAADLGENGLNVEENSAGTEIHDDAKRSVSIRINTSDYGKIKTIARRLRVRESTVFRYLLKNGLQSVAALYQGQLHLREVIDALFEQPEALLSEFNLDQKRLSSLFDEIFDANMEEEDLALIALIALPPRYLAHRLTDTLHRDVAENQAVAMLKRYLLEKYSPTAP